MVGRGFFKLFSVRGVAFRVHWSTPIMAFLAGGIFQSPYVILAMAIVIVLHEIGHAGVMRRFGLRVTAIDVHGVGGVCRGEGNPSEVQRRLIAWGGILAQLALLGATSAFGNKGFLATLAGVNVFLMILNALPLPGLDGWEAWPLFHPRNLRALFARQRRAALRSRADELEAELAASLAREVEREKRASKNLLN